jgi:hypothetical protein
MIFILDSGTVSTVWLWKKHRQHSSQIKDILKKNEFKKCHTVETVPESNIKIIDRGKNRYPEPINV